MDWNDTILIIFVLCIIVIVGILATILRYVNKIVKWLLSPINSRLTKQ